MENLIYLKDIYLCVRTSMDIMYETWFILFVSKKTDDYFGVFKTIVYFCRR